MKLSDLPGIYQVVFALSAIFVTLGVAFTVYAAQGDEHEISLVVDGSTQEIVTRATTVGQVLESNDVALESYDVVEPSAKAEVENGMKIVVTTSFPISVTDGNLTFQTFTAYKTVGEALEQLDIKLKKYDTVIPPLESEIQQNTKILIARSSAIQIKDGNDTREVTTLRETVRGLLDELDITLDDDDTMTPSANALIEPGMTIAITRVEKDEITEEESIPFETAYQDDATLLKGKEQVAVEGQNGVREKTYKIVKENGEEVSRDVVSEEVLQEPVTRVIHRGTKEPIGRVQSGEASWYGTAGLSAASRDFSAGTRLRVTNTANGKTVTVEVVGWGPQAYTGRVIDLSTDAFAVIADLGTGVIHVKIEELL